MKHLYFLLHILSFSMISEGMNFRKHFQEQKVEIQITHIIPVPRNKTSVIPKRFFEAPHNCNIHNQTLLMNNPSLCFRHRKVFLLKMIRTIPSHFDRRMAIRETWGSEKHFPGIHMPIVFLIGLTKNKTEQENMERENKVYGDILQEDFTESYFTLDLKTTMAWKWASEYCPHATFVMVCNDEFIVDMFKLIPYLNSQPKDKSQINFCIKAVGYLVEREHSKWQVSEETYEATHYPAFCVGSGYVAPSVVIRNMYFMSVDTPMFMPDDAWVGIVAEKLGLYLLPTNHMWSLRSVLKKSSRRDYLKSPSLAHVTDWGPDDPSTTMKKIWNVLINYHNVTNVPK